FKPYVIKKIEDVDGTVKAEYGPKLMIDAQKKDSPDDVAISAKTFQIVKEGLNKVFDGPRGTGKSFRINGLNMAGKTGTVQLFQVAADKIYAHCENRDLKQRHNGWMVA